MWPNAVAHRELTICGSVTQNLSDGLRSIVMASAGCKTISYNYKKRPNANDAALVGAMFYISPTLTLLMLTVVPPVSLGAVGGVL